MVQAAVGTMSALTKSGMRFACTLVRGNSSQCGGGRWKGRVGLYWHSERNHALELFGHPCGIALVGWGCRFRR